MGKNWLVITVSSTGNKQYKHFDTESEADFFIDNSNALGFDTYKYHLKQIIK